MRSHERTAHRRARPAQGRLPLPHRRRAVHRRRHAAAARRYAAFLRSPHAHAKIRTIDTDEGEGGAGRGRGLHRRRSRRGEGRRPALRLADHRRQRPADEGAAASRASRRARCATSAIRSRWSSPRPRPRRRTRPSSIDVDYEVLPAVVDAPRRASQGAPQMHDDRAGQHLLRLGARRQGGRRCGVRKGAHVTKLDLVNNRLIPNAIEPRAAIGVLQRAPTTATRCTSRARTRTSSGC